MSIATPPKEPVTINGRNYRSVTEGLASILAPYQEKTTTGVIEKGRQSHNNDEGNQAVFYNPIQQFNRDLTVLAILVYGEGALVSKEALYARKSRTRQQQRTAKKRRKANGVKEVDATQREEVNKELDTTLDGTEQEVGAKPDEAAIHSRKRKLDEVDHEERIEVTKKARPDDEEGVNGNLEVAQLDGAGDEQIDGANGSPAASTKRLPFSILDALSATGLRALRYAKEIPFVTNVIANDVSKDAVAAIELNIDHNDVKGKVHSNLGDARAYMYSKIGNEHDQPSGRNVHRFDVVDLDPYGTAAPFIDAALQCLLDGGMLCVTCTDAGVFASTGYLEKTYSLYGGLPTKGAHSHEAGLRLIIHSIAQTAAKYGLAVEPLLSLSIDFYARVFLRIHRSPNEVKLLAGTTMITYNCDSGCGAWTTQTLARNLEKKDRNGGLIYKHSFSQAPTVPPLCEHCGFKMHIGGPMWAGPLHNPYFVQRMLDRIPSLDPKVYGTTDRLKGMLTVALEEDVTLATSTLSEVEPATHGDSPIITTEAAPEQPYATTNGHSPPSNDPKPAPSPALIPRLPPATIDHAPFLMIPNYLAKVIHTQTPSEAQIWGAIRSCGYRVTRSHCKAGSFKTDAPWSVIWAIYREWVRTKSPIKKGALKKGSPGARILGADILDSETVSDKTWETAEQVRRITEDVAKGLGRADGKQELTDMLRAALYRLEHGDLSMVTTENGQKVHIVFDEKLGREKPREKLVRYQINPRENWGPMNRAGGS
ncbi:tRNA (guanine(26)-N(2))-dimethyltransferase, mitochondrial [Cyphellophora attinorum]|uniref:tRNA (guanine(26)-N(2))-dimethyltransferase n=1 Tax=Cyphellophora attinorum TaxID=1664694 RepID=A0A0N1P1V2_9EURO|nr:tRNA (guanine(26)-N(2))-dimethyltransferase, mitochondrial [Phialophora attinorum]KPI41357.1 tRNA (guanine(26)-N(2))-dimethyltransferase, mitochondrial [Phialophora attinorum]